MKNKINYILLYLIVSFAFINNVFAATTVTLSTDNTTVVSGSEASIKINLKSDEVVTACLIKVTSDDTLEFLEKHGANGWNVTQDGGVDGFTVENSVIVGDVLTNGQNILELKYKVNGSGKITIHTDHCSNGSTNTEITNITDYSINLTVKEKEDDTSLSSLSIVGGEPISFEPTKLTYGVKLNSSTFGLNFTASNPDYQDDIVVKDEDGNVVNDFQNIKFNEPSGQTTMTLYIIVKDTTTYTLGLDYQNVELDNSLESITVNGADLSLEDGKLDYTLDVDSDVDSILIKATLKDSEHFEISESSNVDKEINMNGDTLYANIVIEPKSADLGASGKTYTITIKRKSSSTTPSNPDDFGGTDKEPTTGGNTSGTDNDGNVTQNQPTGDISMFVMALILIASLVGSVLLYRKNLESYR